MAEIGMQQWSCWALDVHTLSHLLPCTRRESGMEVCLHGSFDLGNRPDDGKGLSVPMFGRD